MLVTGRCSTCMALPRAAEGHPSSPERSGAEGGRTEAGDGHRLGRPYAYVSRSAFIQHSFTNPGAAPGVAGTKKPRPGPGLRRGELPRAVSRAGPPAPGGFRGALL